MCPIWLIVGKAALRDVGEVVCRRSWCICRAGGAALVLVNELSVVVWSPAESCRGGRYELLERVRRVMDTPVYHVPLQFE